MSQFAYEISVSISPDQAKKGERVGATITFNEASEKVQRAIVRITEYGILNVLKQVEENVFQWEYVIPWEAPIQNYKLEFIGFNDRGEQGPTKQVMYAIS